MMKEFCIPIGDIRNNERAEVEVRIPGSKRLWKFRIESFNLACMDKDITKEKKIENLRNKIITYDSNWEIYFSRIINSCWLVY